MISPEFLLSPRVISRRTSFEENSSGKYHWFFTNGLAVISKYALALMMSPTGLPLENGDDWRIVAVDYSREKLILCLH